MNARSLGLLLGLAALAATAAYAVDRKDSFERPATLAVGLTGGDTPNTYSVSCSSNTLAAGATQLRPAVTDRSRRNICFQNTSNFPVSIGSSTVATSDFFTLLASSAPASLYCTHNSGAFYCAPASPVTSAATVVVIEETQSIP